MFCIHQPGHFHRRAQKWPLSDAKPRQITFICASVSRILVLLRTLPPTRRHLSLWVPSPTRSSELCAPVATLTRTSHLSSSSYVRRKASEGGGLQYTQTYAPPTHPSAPYHTMLRRNCELGLRRRFANQLTYCMSTRVPSSQIHIFYSKVFLCMVEMLKLTLDQYLETQSGSRFCKGEWKMRRRRCTFMFIDAIG